MRVTTGLELQIETVQTDRSELAIIDRVARINREIRENGRRKEGPAGRYLGTIPMALYDKWKREDPEFANDPAAVERKLMSPEFKKLRVDKGL